MPLDYNELAFKADSPSYVFSEEIFHKRVKEVQEAFGENVNLCFSIKTNPFLMEVLPECFTKVEVCSPGELEICRALNIPPEKILYSGVNKSRDEIERAIKYKAEILTIESYNHLEDINAAAIDAGVVCNVLIRLTAGSQFGMDPDDVEKIIRNRNAYRGIKIRGIHYFSGTMKRKAKVVIREIEKLKLWLTKVRDEIGFDIERIEYGAGLPAAYFDSNPEEKELQILKDVSDAIKDLAKFAELTVEMGRFFASTCGFYITKVVDTKCNEGENYAIVDGGLHQIHYDGQFRGMQLPEIIHIKGKTRKDITYGNQENSSWVICGSLCTTADVLAVNFDAEDLREGDYLIFKRTGAYSSMEGMSIFLSRDLPRIYILKKDGTLLLRRDRFETFVFNMKD